MNFVNAFRPDVVLTSPRIWFSTSGRLLRPGAGNVIELGKGSSGASSDNASSTAVISVFIVNHKQEIYQALQSLQVAAECCR